MRLKVISAAVSLLFSANVFAGHIIGFESAEHAAAGQNITLLGVDNKQLQLSNGLSLSYGDLVTLGDFYGTVGQPISQTDSASERKERFLAAFNMVAADAKVEPELTKILEIIASEKKAIDDGMANGEKPEDVYQKIHNDINRQFNCATGGDCSKNWWVKPGRYLQLAAQDYDHFGENAWRAYQAGHDAALDIAYAAHQTGDLKQLELAYAMNAFASHFLVDRFSAGHIRTPRVELPANVKPPVVGAILASYMHNEESQYGLHVRNYRGDEWIAYGDRYYFDPQNETNRNLLKEALQTSADQIYNAFKQGIRLSKPNLYELFPQADENGAEGALDPASLFYWDADAQKLMRRKDVDNISNYQWTDKWWGWTTLIELSRHHGGLPLEYQAQLATSELRHQAVRDGLITDRNILNFVNQR